MSHVCSIHEEYCPDDTCRWCESPAATPDGLVVLEAPPPSVAERVDVAMGLFRAGEISASAAFDILNLKWWP